jgi:hypothetical protein
MKHEFVKTIPKSIEDGIIYISVDYSTAIHKCCCGCGHEVVTPFSPTDWKLIYDGETVSLYPSIGNWNFDCKSHYWIKNSQVEWAPKWTDEEIQAGRGFDAYSKQQYYKSKGLDKNYSSPNEKGSSTESTWSKIKSWLFE